MKKRTEKLFLDKEVVQSPKRQRPGFREAKHSYRRLFKEHVESTGQGNKSIRPEQQRRQNSQSSTPTLFNLLEILSFNKFVFILAVGGEQRMEVESKLGLLAIFLQVVVFRLPATFNSKAIDGGCEQNTFSHCMYGRRHFVSTSHFMLHAHA